MNSFGTAWSMAMAEAALLAVSAPACEQSNGDTSASLTQSLGCISGASIFRAG